MSRGKHTEAQRIRALKHMEAERKAEDVAREMEYPSTRLMPGSRSIGHGCERGAGGQAAAR